MSYVIAVACGAIPVMAIGWLIWSYQEREHREYREMAERTIKNLRCDIQELESEREHGRW